MCGQTGGETKTDRNTETKIDVWSEGGETKTDRNTETKIDVRSDRRRNEDRQKHRDKDRRVVRQTDRYSD